MTTNLDRASIVSRHVQLESVALAGAKLQSDIDPLADHEKLHLNQGYRADYEIREDRPNHVYVRVEFSFEASDETDAAGFVELLSLTAEYLLAYRLKGAATYPSDSLEHFSQLNGVYNVWPYWRELVQTVTGRVGLAGITVPVFRPPVRELEEQIEMDEEAAAKGG